MILETMRAWADWLGDATYGVNAQLATIPLDGSDTAPDAVAIVADETRNGTAARRQIPDTLPALLVRLQQSGTLVPNIGPNTAVRDGEIPLLTAYAATNADSAKGNRNAVYTLRAIEKSLRDFMDPSIAAANTARMRGNIQILSVTGLEHVTTYEPLEDRDVLAALIVTFQVRDTAP